MKLKCRICQTKSTMCGSVLAIYHKNNRKLNFAESDCMPKECDGMKLDDSKSSKNKLITSYFSII